MSDIKQAAWLKRPEVDYPEVSKDYPLATVVLKEPRKRLNYTSIALAIMLGLSLLGTLYGAGCFDRFIN